MELKHLFKELEAATDTGCWSYNLESKRLFWSDSTYAIHGIDPSTKIDVENAIEYYHHEDREILKEAFAKCLSEGIAYSLELRIINSDGKIVYVETQGKPLYEDGKLKYIFGTLKNINAKVNLLERSHRAEEKYNNLASLLNDHFIVAETDARGKITYANDQFCKISQYSHAELVGKDHRILNSGFHPKLFFEDLWVTIKSGSAWEGLICNKAKDGSLYWVRTFIFPKFREHEITGYMAIRLDVTDDIEVSKELIEEKKKADFSAQLAAVGEMSAGIAHEINNPLTIIGMKLTLLRRSLDDTERAEKHMNAIQESALRIEKIVKGLHHLSQKSRSEDHCVCDVGEVLNYTLEFCSEVLRGKGIDLEFNEIEDNVYILGDRIKLSQIILNLINNARDAIIDSRTKDKWIRLNAFKEGNLVNIDVLDSAPPIPEEIRIKILEPFFTTKEVGRGSGLGLSIVCRFLEEHNGELTLLDGEAGKGFRVTLPVTQV